MGAMSGETVTVPLPEAALSFHALIFDHVGRLVVVAGNPVFVPKRGSEEEYLEASITVWVPTTPVPALR